MAFRDDHDAALARINALERELAETKAALSDKERADAEAAEAEADDAEADDAEADDAEADDATPAKASSVLPAPRSPQSVGNRTEHGVTIRSTGSTVQLSWFGWGTGNFVSAVLMFPLPVFAFCLLVIWLAKGMPPVIPFDLPLPLFLVAAVAAVWNTAALALNHRNHIRVGASQLSATQGVVPWLVGYRRRHLPVSSIRSFDVDEDWDPESEATQYRVRARHGNASTPVTAWFGTEDKARLIAAELATATRTSVT